MNTATIADRQRRPSLCWLVLCAAAPLASCGAFVHGKALVPGTNQRLLVGHDNWPHAKIWVEENGEIHPVTIKWEKDR